ncbi:hypothetical protein BGX34_003063 [Mortierella sp. NVP85]|nr:hypothetical protein BGX34_003063 [Mortierella sp. NVP85]
MDQLIARQDSPSGPSNRMYAYSREWMTLPTLTMPTDDGEVDISNERDPEVGGKGDIDDTARSKHLEGMRSTIATFAQRCMHRQPAPDVPAGNTVAVTPEDANLFLALYDACFHPENERLSVSQLKREMMIQILEDFGDQLLDNQAEDPLHKEYLRRTIVQWKVGDRS